MSYITNFKNFIVNVYRAAHARFIELKNKTTQFFSKEEKEELVPVVEETVTVSEPEAKVTPVSVTFKGVKAVGVKTDEIKEAAMLNQCLDFINEATAFNNTRSQELYDLVLSGEMDDAVAREEREALDELHDRVLEVATFIFIEDVISGKDVNVIEDVFFKRPCVLDAIIHSGIARVKQQHKDIEAGLEILQTRNIDTLFGDLMGVFYLDDSKEARVSKMTALFESFKHDAEDAKYRKAIRARLSDITGKDFPYYNTKVMSAALWTHLYGKEETNVVSIG